MYSELIVGLIYRHKEAASGFDFALKQVVIERVNMGAFDLPATRPSDLFNTQTGFDMYMNYLESYLYQHVNETTRV